jgi:hypothetical protein
MKEGDTRIISETCVRRECFECGEPATKRITYLRPNARNNPQSSGYGKDDISWCCDEEEFTCDEHEKKSSGGSYEYCATFTYGERFAHMFLYWAGKVVEYKTK